MESKTSILMKKGKQIELDILNEEIERLRSERDKLNSKAASGVSVIGYILGFVLTTIIATALFYSLSKAFIIFSILAYGTIFPKIMIYKNMYKKAKLTNNINNLNIEINKLARELKLYDLIREKNLNLDATTKINPESKAITINKGENTTNSITSLVGDKSNINVSSMSEVKTNAPKKLIRRREISKNKIIKR